MATECKIPKLCLEEAHCVPEENVTAQKNEPQLHFLPTDVILEVEGRDIYVNKQVLADHSRVFKAMFESDFTEKHKERISLPEKKYADFVNLLYTFYYPEREDLITDKTVLKITPLAEEYQISVVKNKCEKFLEEVCKSTARDVDKHIETSTLVEYTACAEQFNMKFVLPSAIQLCAECPTESLKRAGIEIKLTGDLRKSISDCRNSLMEKELKPYLDAGSRTDFLKIAVLLWDSQSSTEKRKYEDSLVSFCKHQSGSSSSQPSAISLHVLLGYIIAAERFNLRKLLEAAIDLASRCSYKKLRKDERYQRITDSSRTKILVKRMELFEDEFDSWRREISESRYNENYNKIQ
ncbi:BTB and MATH domain-containing protein 42-like [Saccostrea cucullata]|uniref:BTB and MATH domain-containing protein 42-like n=1 Tax=Saccostrea cuccullata TaxID=36930 RepID=UPI002ED4BBD8